MRILIVVLLALLIIVGGVSYKARQSLALRKSEQSAAQQVGDEKNTPLHQTDSEAVRDGAEVGERKSKDESGNAAAQEKMRLETLQAKVMEILKDPGSAQFRLLKLNAGETALCGDVNAKNAMGGYVGFRPFVATEAGAAIWNGGCDNAGSYDRQIACQEELLAYLGPAVRSGCKSQEEVNKKMLSR